MGERGSAGLPEGEEGEKQGVTVGAECIPALEITGVSMAETGESDVSSAAIIEPKVGKRADTYSLEIVGWVAAPERPIATVKLTHDGRHLWRIPASAEHAGVVPPDMRGAARGFAAAISTLTVPAAFEIELSAVPEEGAPVPMATIRGSRAELRTGIASPIRPLMVNTFGRTGSRVFLQLLAAHPDVVAYMAPQYEPKAATYWVEVLRALSEPKSYLSQIHTGFGRRDWWLGGDAPALWRIPDQLMQAWMEREAIDALARICQERIDAFYTRAAARSGRPAAAYFAEKFTATTTPSLLWELYPDAREVILVRDFRDMTASVLAFNERKGRQMFGRDRSETDEEFVVKLGAYADTLSREWRRRADRAHLLRYEDLMLKPGETVQGLVEYLELETPPETVRAMVASLSYTPPEMSEHRTTSDSGASVGRWRDSLSDELKEACRGAFAPALEAFGYPVES